MKYILYILFTLPFSIFCQTKQTIDMRLNFNPPVGREVLDKLRNDTTGAWIRFSKANYCFYLHDKEIDPEHLQKALRISDKVKNNVDIERQKPLIIN